MRLAKNIHSEIYIFEKPIRYVFIYIQNNNVYDKIK